MKLRRLRLALRDGSALMAFVAMFISGELPVWIPIVFFGGILVAWMGKRPVATIGNVSVVFLIVAAIALYSAALASQLDLVIAACSFAGILSLHRVLAEPTPATDGHVLLTNLLMLAGGAALSGDMLFALCLAAFAVLTILSLGLGTLETHHDSAIQMPLRAPLRVLGWGGAATLAGTVLLFVLIPRLSWNVAANRAGRGLNPRTGFAGEVRLGGGRGKLKTDPRTLARVTMKPSPRDAKLDAYWPGTVLTAFDGRAWSKRAASGERHAQAQRGTRSKGAIEQRVELLPGYGSETAIGLETPILFLHAQLSDTRGTRPIGFLTFGREEVRFDERAPTYRYSVISQPKPRAVPDAEEDEGAREEELALPEGLDPRVEALARTLIGDASTEREKASRIEKHLRTRFVYSLELVEDPTNPLEHFLFERREGHCEYFATALTVMLRTVGVRARLVTGFFGGDRANDGAYLLRAGDAHSWTEVFIPDEGYVRFDATPQEYRSAQPDALWASVVNAFERLEDRWRALVVEYSIREQASLAMSITGTKSRWERRDDEAKGRKRSALPWQLLAAGLASGLGAWLYVRVKHGAADEAARLRRTLTGILGDADVEQRGLEETARAWQNAAGRNPGEVETLRRAVDRYLAARFGTNELSSEERRHWEQRLRPLKPRRATAREASHPAPSRPS